MFPKILGPSVTVEVKIFNFLGEILARNSDIALILQHEGEGIFPTWPGNSISASQWFDRLSKDCLKPASQEENALLMLASDEKKTAVHALHSRT